MRKKHIFPRASSGHLLNQKQKKAFVSLSDEVTKVWHLPLVEWLGAILFKVPCRMPGGLETS